MLLRALRPWIARGYQPPPPRPSEPRWVRPLSPPAGDGPLVLAFCPTYVGAHNAESQAATVREVAAGLREAGRRRPGLRLLLLIGLQFRDGEEGEGARRSEALCGLAAAEEVAGGAFLLAGYGKVRSVNVALRAALGLGAAGLLQVDDDIRLEPGCLAELCRAFLERGCRGAVGATKIGLARANRASRLLRWLKGQTRPAVNYPHACCMLLAPAALAPEIPSRYVSDDGYVCFTLLRPGAPDPFADLRLVPAARCRHFVGGPAGTSVRRIRRMLLNHHIYIADFPPEVGRFYVRHILFPGLWPIGAPDPQGGPGRALRWALQALYFLWFAATGLELALRGLAGRPLREVKWAGFSDRRAPEGAAPLSPAAPGAPEAR